MVGNRKPYTITLFIRITIEENDIVRSELLESKIWIEKNFPNEKTVLKISYPYSKYHEYAKSYFKFCRIKGKHYRNQIWFGNMEDKDAGNKHN